MVVRKHSIGEGSVGRLPDTHTEVPQALVYYPNPGAIKNGRTVGWSVTTRLMAVAAICPFSYCQGDIADLTSASQGTLSRVTDRLDEELGWIDHLKEAAYRPGRPAYNLFATSTFWESRATIVQAASAIPDKQLRAYEEAREAFVADYHDPNAKEGNPNFRTRGQWVGLTAILGDTYDLSQHGTWEKGPAGWDLLIRTSVPVNMPGEANYAALG